MYSNQNCEDHIVVFLGFTAVDRVIPNFKVQVFVIYL